MYRLTPCHYDGFGWTDTNGRLGLWQRDEQRGTSIEATTVKPGSSRLITSQENLSLSIQPILISRHTSQLKRGGVLPGKAHGQSGCQIRLEAGGQHSNVKNKASWGVIESYWLLRWLEGCCQRTGQRWMEDNCGDWRRTDVIGSRIRLVRNSAFPLALGMRWTTSGAMPGPIQPSLDRPRPSRHRLLRHGHRPTLISPHLSTKSRTPDSRRYHGPAH